MVIHVLFHVKYDKSIIRRVDLKDKNVMIDILSKSVFFETGLRCQRMFLKALKELKQKHAICLGWAFTELPYVLVLSLKVLLQFTWRQTQYLSLERR